MTKIIDVKKPDVSSDSVSSKKNHGADFTGVVASLSKKSIDELRIRCLQKGAFV